MYEAHHTLSRHLQKTALAKYDVLAIRLFLRYLELHGLPPDAVVGLKKRLRTTKSNPDMFVPGDAEIMATLEELRLPNRLLFCLYLTSGLRKVEGWKMVRELGTLRVQHQNGFIKINLSSFRNTKSAFFCYLPLWLFEQIQKHATTLSLDSLDTCLKRNKCIPVKYARKWFFTKCVELGVPESIADFYEGRVSTTIGANHYLSKQMLADKYYREILNDEFNRFRRFFDE